MAIFQQQTGAANPLNGFNTGALHSSASFIDIDADGDLDVFNGAFNNGLIYFYRNVGTPTTPAFTEITGAANPLNSVDVGAGAPGRLTFGDPNSDGAFGAVIGAGSVLQLWTNQGTPTTPNLVQVTASNPFSAYNTGANFTYPQFADIDNDDDIDIFFGLNNGTIDYWQNLGTPTSNNFVQQTGAANPLSAVSVSSRLCPSFTDIDKDGDLDAFISRGDGYVDFWQNNGPANNPSFTQITGGANPFDNIIIGSGDTVTINFADIDNDGDSDAFFGDSTGDLYLYENISPVATIAPGTTPEEVGSAVTGNFVVTLSQAAPVGGLTITYNVAGTATAGADYNALSGSVFIAQGATTANINVTPLLDAVVDPSETVQVTLTSTPTAAYSVGPQNTAVLRIADETPDTYTELTGAANPLNSVNVGNISTPTFANIDGDGDLDAFIGAFDGTISYYRNDGSATSPIFSLQTGAVNPFNGVDVGSNSAPTFVDIDGDGDSDAFIGNDAGTVDFYRNNGGTFSLQSGGANPLNAATFLFVTTPTFVDIDRDGDFDAFVGADNGTIQYYKNTGTAFNATFTQITGAANPLNGVNVGNNSIPTFADIDGDGDLDALIGADDGTVKLYRNDAGTFTLQTGANPLNSVDVGDDSAPTFVDINGDGDLDALIGADDGTVKFYENAPTVTLTAGTTPAEAGATSGTFTLTLSDPAPDTGITVNYTVAGTATSGNDYTSLSGSVTVAPGATTATINVATIDDSFDDDAETVIVTLTDAASYNLGTPNNNTLAITDNDTSGVTIAQSASSTNPTEGAVTDSYTVVLNTIPINPVTVTLTPSNSQINLGAGAGNPVNLNFAADATALNPQTVTVTAVDDVVAESNHISAIAHSSTSTDAKYNGAAVPFTVNGVANADVTVNITDNESAGVSIAPSGGTTNITEGGATDTYDIVLTSAPTAPVTINFNTGSQINPIPAIIFDNTNWNIPRTITVTATDDAQAEGNHNSTITHTATSADAAYNGFAIASTAVAITDNDSAAVSIASSAGSTTVAEGGTSDTYDIVLTSAPIAPVTISFNTDSQLGAIPDIVFDNTNWNIPRTITATAIDDAIAQGDRNTTIAHTASSADTNYNGIAIASTAVAITDNDTAGVSITPSGGIATVTEGGATDSYDIVLTTAPTAPVTINFATNSQINPIASVTFDSNNWNIAQTVTVQAADDPIVEGNHSSTVTPTATSADAAYNGIAIAPITASITDNDAAIPPGTPGITLIQPAGNTNVIEGFGQDNYKLVLDSQPTDNVTITISTDGQTATDLQTLIFTSTNWNVAQTVTVTAIDDAATEGERVSNISHAVTSADARYNGLAISPVSANVSDNESPGLTINLSQASALGFTDFDDKITGSTGNDIIYGRIGNDIIDGKAGNDVLYGQSGNNGIAGGDGNDILVGDIGNDQFNGNAGDDIIYADAGSDRARGGAGSDQLFGEDGNDRLFGDLGADTLTGGGGNDAFAIGLEMGGLTVETADFIADFTLNGDKIDLIATLTFERLNIVQGTGVYANNTIIQDSITAEFLAVLQGVAASSLTGGNFV